MRSATKRLVVLVVARAQAELAAEARIAEVLVARHGVGGDALGRAHRRADTGADAPPRAVRVAQALVDVRAQRRGLDRLEQPGLLGAPEVREVRGHEQVGGRLVAFAAQPLEELGRGAAAQLDVQAGLLLERLEGLLVAVLRAAVVDHDVGGTAERERGDGEQGDHEHDGAGDEPSRFTVQREAIRATLYRLVPSPDLAIDAVGVAKSFGATRAVDDASIAVDDGHARRPARAERLRQDDAAADDRRLRGAGRGPDRDRAIDPSRATGPGSSRSSAGSGWCSRTVRSSPTSRCEANVAFGATRRERVAECLELVGLPQRADAFPHELSGGERQRIALARALASDPDVVLLDEPFAALDAGLRDSLRQEVRRILKDAGKSALLVTHDQAEALSLADTVAVMRGGRVLQVGTPEEIYERPRSRWLAEFLGEADVLPGRASAGVVECELGRFGVPRALEGAVDVVLRPESVAIGLETAHGDYAEARVVGRSFYGHDQLVDLELPSGMRLRSRRLGFPAWHPGDRVRVWVDGPVNALERGAD